MVGKPNSVVIGPYLHLSRLPPSHLLSEMWGGTKHQRFGYPFGGKRIDAKGSYTPGKRRSEANKPCETVHITHDISLKFAKQIKFGAIYSRRRRNNMGKLHYNDASL